MVGRVSAAKISNKVLREKRRRGRRLRVLAGRRPTASPKPVVAATPSIATVPLRLDVFLLPATQLASRHYHSAI